MTVILFFFSSLYFFSKSKEKYHLFTKIIILCYFIPVFSVAAFFGLAGRFMVPYATILLLPTAMGLEKTYLYLKKKIPDSCKLVFGIAFTVILLYFFVSALRDAKEYKNLQEMLSMTKVYPELGRWVDRNLPANAKLMDLTDDSFFYYCGRKTLAIPNASCNEIWRFAKNKGISYLVVSDGTILTYRPDLEFLLKNKDSEVKCDSLDLIRIASQTEPGKFRYAIFKLKD